jgi:uncharacterized protein YukE
VSADLAYATSELTSLGGELKSLSDQIKGDGDLGDVGVDRVAHQKVADALDDFAGDWDDKRETLGNSLESISKQATQAADEFTKADEELAKEIRDAFEGEQ